MLSKWRNIKAFANRLFHLLEANNALASDSSKMLKEILTLTRETQNLVVHHDRLLQRNLALHESSLSNQISLMETQLELLKRIRDQRTDLRTPANQDEKCSVSVPARYKSDSEHLPHFNFVHAESVDQV